MITTRKLPGALAVICAVALASKALCGCGGDECTEPGSYRCTYKVTDSDCPAGSVLDTWTAQIAVESKVCETEVHSGSDTINGCQFNCSESLEPGMPPTISGGCTVICPGQGTCTYSTVATCK